MSRTHWTLADIQKLYHLDVEIGRQLLLNAEASGEIPSSQRITRGQAKVRTWTTDQLPSIGAKYGFLRRPEKPIVISLFVQKGGVLKTTTAHNLARVLALSGVKVLVIGTDFECSITDLMLPQKEITSLTDSEVNDQVGLFHFFEENAAITDVIINTDLPTLDIIPETHELNLLEKVLRNKQRREYCFVDQLLPKLSNYDVIIFDNGPGWNMLIENVLTASNVVVAPLGCTLLAYKATQTNMDTIDEFVAVMRLSLKTITIATMLDDSNISKQIYERYLAEFSSSIIPVPIRTSSKGQAAQIYGQSIFEYAPTSSLAIDYKKVITTLWTQLGNECPSEHFVDISNDEL